MAAAPGAFVVPAGAAPDAVAAGSGVGQVDPVDPDVPVEEPWADEEEEEEESAEPDSLIQSLPVKPSTVAPDSSRSGILPDSSRAGLAPDSTRFKNAIPVGGAQPETLGYKPQVVGAGAAKPTPAKPVERRTPLGIHPAAFFLLLAVGHVFIVRAVTD